ncbi:hypothetical protein ACOXC5_007225 [Klebsiella michiganensis]
MTKSTITRERIEQYANDPRMCNINDEIREMARMALAAMGSEPITVTDDMAYAFHHALTDGPLGNGDVEEIKAGLRAAFANVSASQPVPQVSELQPLVSEVGAQVSERPAPKDDHNALDDIIIFLDSERNPTRKEFQDITYRAGADECSSCAQHIIGYIREISSELIGLRERINKPAQTNGGDEPTQHLTFRLKDGREIGGIATGITAMPGVIVLRDENDPYLFYGVPDNEIAQIFFFTRRSVGSTGDSIPGYHIALDEPLKEYLRLVGCMVSDHRERNFGDAQRWIRHIAKASDAFEKKHGLSPWEMARKNRKNDRAAMLQAGNSPVIPDCSYAAAHTGIPMIPDGYVMVPKDLLSELRDWAHPEIEKYCEMWEGRRDSEFPALRKVIADADALLAAAPQEAK